ncbi:peptidase inhibitor family I36 protein [Streptomyces sp. ST1020]|uniref:peptidase inhibitor family I36 protein n=1 Tax=unclassified Streptomyces TaxID=2593676 RepID=UPI0034C69FA7
MAAIAGGSLVSAPAASAAPGDCPDNYVCIFQNVNYEGRWIGNLRGHDRPNVGDYMNDRASSIINNTNDPIKFYEHSGYRGASFWMYPRVQLPRLYEWNDSISSWKRCDWQPPRCD